MALTLEACVRISHNPLSRCAAEGAGKGRPDDDQDPIQPRRACSEAPKGLYIEAQGKRSATLGHGHHHGPSPERAV